MSARAGIVVTGTEVLTGRVSDRNGPWLAERLREIGVDLAHTVIVGDRPADMLAALGWLASHKVDVVLTSGGLGPTADDLTASVVGEFCGREMVLDEELEARIMEILRPHTQRWPDLDMDALRLSNRKQAVIPAGATVLEPVGTAPGLVVPPGAGRAGPTVVVLPGPPRELQPMWQAALATPALGEALAGASVYRQEMLRIFGIPESEIAETLRVAEEAGIQLGELEITTCLRRGEVEVVTRFEPPAADTYAAFAGLVRARHAEMLFSDDGTTVDQQVARLLIDSGRTLGVAESCTGGLLAARLTEMAGASAYMRGGVVAYSDRTKRDLLDVSAAVIESAGAVSVEVAQALADGARRRLSADVGIGITGVAGPGGGTPEKPVGLVCLSVTDGAGHALTRQLEMPGARADIRDRSTTVAMHMLRRLLLGESDTPAA